MPVRLPDRVRTIRELVETIDLRVLVVGVHDLLGELLLLLPEEVRHVSRPVVHLRRVLFEVGDRLADFVACLSHDVLSGYHLGGVWVLHGDSIVVAEEIPVFLLS